MIKTQVYLGLGSNIGDRQSTINKAVNVLSRFLGNIRLSRLYESSPRYVMNQPLFLNAVAAGETNLCPQDLLVSIHEVESMFGRNRSRESIKGPRTLDVDILLYGYQIIRTDDLEIPHPRIKERKFVLLPLLDLSPDEKDPVTGVYYNCFLRKLSPQGIYYASLNEYTAIFQTHVMKNGKDHGGSTT